MKQMNKPAFVYRFEAATQDGAPTLLLLHGSGGDETSLLKLGRAMAPGAALLSPRGNVTDHGASRFFARHDNASGDDSEVQERALELSSFVAAATTHYKIRYPMIPVGYSHGAVMALHFLVHSKQRGGGAILMRGAAAEEGFKDSRLKSMPVLILGGIADPLVQSDETEELAVQLRAAGAEVTLHWEEAGHDLCQGDILMAFDWIRRFYTLPRTTVDAK